MSLPAQIASKANISRILQSYLASFAKAVVMAKAARHVDSLSGAIVPAASREST
jgi:hypothetical protein